MKIYVVPVEDKCNAKCVYCITKFRDRLLQADLHPKILEGLLEDINPEKIEITGGGEPTLSKDIGEIIKICCNKSPTQMYTNGSSDFFDEINLLSKLCISRPHYDSEKNKEIMGLNNDCLGLIKKSKIPIKLNSLLLKSGINSLAEIKKYIHWAQSYGIDEIVFRQLFASSVNHAYKEMFDTEFVSCQKLIDDISKDKSFVALSDSRERKIYSHSEVKIEFELRSCACENNNQVIYPDGRISSWRELR